MDSKKDLLHRMDAVWEKIAEADLAKARATVKKLETRKAADKADADEGKARAKTESLWDEWRALHEQLNALQSGEAAS